MTYQEKKNALNNIIKEASYPALAYSGGADSSLLAALCYKYHRDTVKIYAVMTPYADRADIAFASAQANREHWPLCWMRLNLMSLEDIAFNRSSRCYVCKSNMLAALKGKGETEGAKVFLEGSNSDDLKKDRPGFKAVKELGFISPLAEACFTKEDVRTYCRELKLKAAERPSQSCMLTRFPFNMESAITGEMLDRIIEGEHALLPYVTEDLRLRWQDENTALAVVSAFDKVLLSVGGKTFLKNVPFENVIIKEKD